MTLETVGFLLNLVNSLNLAVANENFADTARLIQQVKAELNEEVILLTAPVVD